SREVLCALNERQDAALAPRREVIKRIATFDDFSTCWPDDRLKAEGLVSRVRSVVDMKDSFTRMNNERERERKERQAQAKAELEAKTRKQEELEGVKRNFYALFAMTDVYKRGKVRRIFISASGYSDGAITDCRFALQQKVFVLCELQELVMLLEHRKDLKELIRAKVRAAVAERNPFSRCLDNI